ncbi:DNA adenine methylase [Sagittula sp. SSi028]|uniref:DNA adenine methylase n=1 Tax=Sagittula sp. SSi028 TaxID=3400636 RepID=UPI003AF48E11
MSDIATKALFQFRDAENIPSAIKWTGSKRSQACRIAQLAPSFERYIEPFLGGGAIMFLAAHPGAVGSDIYKPLVELWQTIRDEPDTLIGQYEQQWLELNAELDGIDSSTMTRGNGVPSVFYQARDRFNKSPNPIDLNFLMRTCVNGIVRFNDRGEFNNSFHLSRRGMQPNRFGKAVKTWSRVLQGVHLVCRDYRDVLQDTKRGDFVYFDPPYAGNKQRYAESLTPEELFQELEKLNVKGVKWALSYDGTRGDLDLTHDVPKDLFKVRHFIHSGNSTVKKVLSGKVERVEETLYLNY